LHHLIHGGAPTAAVAAAAVAGGEWHNAWKVVGEKWGYLK